MFGQRSSSGKFTPRKIKLKRAKLEVDLILRDGFLGLPLLDVSRNFYFWLNIVDKFTPKASLHQPPKKGARSRLFACLSAVFLAQRASRLLPLFVSFQKSVVSNEVKS